MNYALVRNFLFVGLILSGCAAASEPDEVVVPIPEPIKTEEPPPPAKPPAATKEATTIIKAAEQAKIDATGYVAWKKSRPENIERLTTLTLNLNGALHRMERGKTKGHYAPGDVAAAQVALKDLQNFLQNKGD